jgi:arylsulfatase A-like enzyme
MESFGGHFSCVSPATAADNSHLALPPRSVDPRIARLYRRAYYASTSYQDYNIGRVLGTLETLGYSANTVVVLFGDHVRPDIQLVEP